MDDSVLWESIKAVLRGSFISYVAGRKKQTEKRLGELDQSVSKLEHSHKATADPDTSNTIVSQRDEYNTILSAQVSKQMNKMKEMQFENGDKPQKLLARQLRQAHASRAILTINSDTGTDPTEINAHFMEFYSNLYKSNGNHNTDAIQQISLGTEPASS